MCLCVRERASVGMCVLRGRGARVGAEANRASLLDSDGVSAVAQLLDAPAAAVRAAAMTALAGMAADGMHVAAPLPVAQRAMLARRSGRTRGEIVERGTMKVLAHVVKLSSEDGAVLDSALATLVCLVPHNGACDIVCMSAMTSARAAAVRLTAVCCVRCVLCSLCVESGHSAVRSDVRVGRLRASAARDAAVRAPGGAARCGAAPGSAMRDRCVRWLSRAARAGSRWSRGRIV